MFIYVYSNSVLKLFKSSNNTYLNQFVEIKKKSYFFLFKMNFNDLHVLAKRIDTQVQSLETKLANPMSMMYSNNSSQGVKVISMLKGLIDDVEKKKVLVQK